MKLFISRFYEILDERFVEFFTSCFVGNIKWSLFKKRNLSSRQLEEADFGMLG